MSETDPMDVSTFYALFSATCFTLVGLWWNVVSTRPRGCATPELRRAVGGIYAAFLLPAMMGLFAQVGGTKNPEVWRASFVVIAVVGAISTVALLVAGRDQRSAAPLLVGPAWSTWSSRSSGRDPSWREQLDLRPIEAEALLLILLVGIGPRPRLAVHGRALRRRPAESRHR